MKSLPQYPVVHWTALPEAIQDGLREYCVEQDLHPHANCYIEFNVTDPEFVSISPVLVYFYSIGIKPEQGLVLIKFDI